MSDQMWCSECGADTWKETAHHCRPQPRCTITGKPCGTDTWSLHQPPDCWCGTLVKQKYAEIALLREWCRIYEGSDIAHWRAEHPEWSIRLREIQAALDYNPASDGEEKP